MVDLTLVNGRIWTGNPAAPWAEAAAVTASRFIKVGSNPELAEFSERAGRVVDLSGRLALPGFIDCHTHFLAGGFALSAVRLGDVTKKEDFVARVAARAAELGPGKWVTNGDWDHEKLVPPELPRRDWIDAVTPANPVFINRLDGHMALANSLALRLAGITRETRAPAGGEIVRDPATGEPTGILKDAAMNLVAGLIPEPSLEDKLAAAEAALRHAAEYGVTSLAEMADSSSLEVFQELERRGRLTARISVYIPVTEVGLLASLKLKSPFGGAFLKLAGLKGFVDGSLGSSTACFFEPYADDPGTRGLFHEQMFPEGVMEKRLLEADRAGLQVAVHAIGDRANKVLLDMFENVAKAHGPRDRRWRVEHAQHLRSEDIARFGRLGVIASVQPYHLVDDGCWAERKVGPERAKTTYAFRSLLDAGAVVVFGSDWTVAPLDPLAGIYAAVTRRTLDGANPDGWHPEQKVSVEEAVRAYTLSAAWSEFAEKDKGTVERGKLADLVVLDHDIFSIPAAEIADVKAAMTIVGGRVVYEKPEPRPAGKGAGPR
mgnify:CR=1 FL=1